LQPETELTLGSHYADANRLAHFFLDNSAAPSMFALRIEGLCSSNWFSSNLARKKRRLEGNEETVETVTEETKKVKPLKTHDFP
jgi:hypothetical protein